MSGPKSEGGWSPRVSLQDISAWMAPKLGQEKSVEAVDVAAKHLSIRGPMVERAQAEAILEHLSKSSGLVGVAARSAQRQVASKSDDAPPSSSVHPMESSKTPPADSGKNSVRAELVSLLSGVIGAEKAEEAVSTTGRKLGLGKMLDFRQASAILEELANMPGPIGATARFARARFLLRKKQ